MAGKKGMIQPTQNQATRDAKALANIENWMDQILEGHITCVKCRKDFEAKELQPSAVALLKARYDKLRPSLTAVEQTNINPEEKLSEEQIILKLQQVISANPELVSKLLADHAKSHPGIKECGENTKTPDLDKNDSHLNPISVNNQ